MITVIIKSYLIAMLGILIGSIVLFVTGLVFIFKLSRKKPKDKVKAKVIAKETIGVPKFPAKPITITSHDINAIAGDDIIATQLDLARAYIETGKSQLAKKILKHAMEKGSPSQQQEANSLLGLI